MNNLNNKNLINFILPVFAVLILSVVAFMPMRTNAYFGQDGVNVFRGDSQSIPTTVSHSTTTTTTAPKPAPVKKPVVKKTTPAKAAPVNCATDANTNKDTTLAAGAIFGSDGFMPKNIFQWFLLFVMILMIVLLTRKIVAKDRHLKHA